MTGVLEPYWRERARDAEDRVVALEAVLRQIVAECANNTVDVTDWLGPEVLKTYCQLDPRTVDAAKRILNGDKP